MQVRTIDLMEHAELLDLLDQELRPSGAMTRAVDDFPVALSAENREGLYVLGNSGHWDACLASLVRPFRTSLGDIRLAAIGNVVTRPGQRGQGLSSRLQSEVLDCLRAQHVHLAVLWSDNPQWYSGRGFRAAGVEYHVDLGSWRPPPWQSSHSCLRKFQPFDTDRVSDIYQSHPFFTHRKVQDNLRLYTMPGTTGMVMESDDHSLLAYAFCGKGADFHEYVLEWGGKPQCVLPLLDRARAKGLAHRVLIPQGSESLLTILTQQGARWFPCTSGLWMVLDPGRLVAQATANLGRRALNLAGDPADPVTWLGWVTKDGSIQPGLMRLAIWGFDSV